MLSQKVCNKVERFKKPNIDHISILIHLEMSKILKTNLESIKDELSTRIDELKSKGEEIPTIRETVEEFVAMLFSSLIDYED